MGWNAGANQILEVKNEANQPIQWFTDATQRMELSPASTYTIGSFITQVKNGSLLLCPKVTNFYGNGAPGPFSLLHLAAEGDNSQSHSYREWMNTGITLTGNSDHSYMGQKAGELDYTDMIVHWSDNPGESLKDRMRFLFTSGFDQNATTGAQSVEGLEFMRMFPARFTEPFIGIGDWYAANIADPTIIEPEERLDIVNGKVRIRQLPSDATSTSDELVTVNTTTGVLEHRPANALPDNCEWTMSNTSPNHVITAYGAANASCPDDAEHVGIGTTAPFAKLQVERRPQGGNVDETGIWARTFVGGTNSGTYSTSYALRGNIRTASGDTPCARHYGSEGVADGGTLGNVGVRGSAAGNNNITEGNRGVSGTASGTGDAYGAYGLGAGSGTWNYGVYGLAYNTGTNNYAGWFQGDLMVTGTPFSTAGGPFTASDEALKTNVEPIGDATDVIAQLEPKTYSFLTAEHPHMNLPEGEQAGFMAQEVEALLPQLVKSVTFPAQYDSTGAQTAEEVPMKTLNYTGLIPYLVAAFQEQKARTDALEEQLALCCSEGGQRSLPSDPRAALETDLRIIPNPVADRTELRYTVGSAGRVRLEITDGTGRIVLAREEGSRERASYVYEWDTTALAPGTYQCSLYVNDEPLVKKAVKLNPR